MEGQQLCGYYKHMSTAFRNQTRPAAIYCRISQDRTGAGLGVGRQEEDCRCLAEERGLEVAEVYVDDDLSAYSGKPRPAYLRLLEDLRSGRYGAVIAWHADRLHRSPLELEEWIEVCEAQGVATVTCKAGHIDLETPSGRAVARTLGAWARFESEHKSDRIRRAMQQIRDSGRFTGGPFPYGWRRDDGVTRPPYEINPVEAAVIRDAADHILAGWTLIGTTEYLNERGHLSPAGKPWAPTPLKQVLLRAKNAGLVVNDDGEIVAQSVFPAILPEDQWRAVVAIVANPDRKLKAPRHSRFLLSGLALCGTCGKTTRVKVVGTRSGKSHRIYTCFSKGSGHPHKRREYVESYVTDVVLAYLEQPGVLAALSEGLGRDGRDEERRSLAERADGLRRRRDAAAESYALGKMPLATLERVTESITAELEDVEKRQVALVSDGALSAVLTGGDIRAAWEAASTDQRRAVIDALCTVTLLPTPRVASRRFDPSTVRIEWKCEPVSGADAVA